MNKCLKWLAIAILASGLMPPIAMAQVTQSITNNATATVIGQVAKKVTVGSATQATPTLTSDASNNLVLGITAGTGPSNTALIAQAGQISCTFDAGGSTAGDAVGVSTATGGDCEDIGTTPAPGLIVVGYVLSTNAGTGSYLVSAIPPFAVPGGKIRSYAGATDTLTAADCSYVVHSTGSSSVTETVANTLPAGCNIAVEQIGTGVITFAAAGGATQHTPCSTAATNAQYAIIQLHTESNAGTAAVYDLVGGCT